jgi:glycerophosphoryl diester phosphodiesterase
MYAQLPRPTIFAHRGSSAYAPENTIAAFELAIKQNSDAIELDVKLSLDQNIIVIHDQTLDRTTDGKGNIKDYTITALKEFDAGIKFDEAFRGERIPTLSDVFEAVGRKIFINIELTNYTSPLDSLPEKIAETVKFHSLENQVLFSSFNPIGLLRIQRILPNIPIGLLALPGKSGAWARSFLGRLIPYQAIHPEVTDTTYQLIHNFHRLGYRIHTYTVNQIDKMRQLFQWKIDGIFTDDPLLAKRVLSDLNGEDS